MISKKRESTARSVPERVCSQARRYRKRYANLQRYRARLNFVISKKRESTARVFSRFWPTRKDSNLRPSESESDALSSCATGRDPPYYNTAPPGFQVLFPKIIRQDARSRTCIKSLPLPHTEKEHPSIFNIFPKST